jgi:hypothetical protein
MVADEMVVLFVCCDATTPRPVRFVYRRGNKIGRRSGSNFARAPLQGCHDSSRQQIHVPSPFLSSHLVSILAYRSTLASMLDYHIPCHCSTTSRRTVYENARTCSRFHALPISILTRSRTMKLFSPPGSRPAWKVGSGRNVSENPADRSVRTLSRWRILSRRIVRCFLLDCISFCGRPEDPGCAVV